MFFSCTHLREVCFQGPVEEIRERAFSGCYELVRVSVPPGLKRIGVEAFYGCTSLEEAPLPEGVEAIGRQAFANDRYLTRLTLPASLERMEGSVFHGCMGIRELTLPGFLKEVPENSFYNCRGIRSLSIQPGVERIEDRVFGRCDGLEEVELPPSVTSLGDGVFEGCRSLRAVKLAEGLREVGSLCFSGCTALSRLEIPGSVSRIGGNAFERCEALADGQGFILREGCLYAYLGERLEIEVPAEAHAVASGAFADHPRYRRIDLHPGVTAVGEGAFRNCGALEQLWIWSPQVRTLGEDPFAGCPKLLTATICGMTPEDVEDPLAKEAMALGYCGDYHHFDGETAKGYTCYLNEWGCEDRLMRKAIDHQLLHAMRYFTEQERIGMEVFDQLLDYAQKKRAMEIVALLLAYRERYGQRDVFEKYGL